MIEFCECGHNWKEHGIEWSKEDFRHRRNCLICTCKNFNYSEFISRVAKVVKEEKLQQLKAFSKIRKIKLTK